MSTNMADIGEYNAIRGALTHTPALTPLQVVEILELMANLVSTQPWCGEGDLNPAVQLTELASDVEYVYVTLADHAQQLAEEEWDGLSAKDKAYFIGGESRDE